MFKLPDAYSKYGHLLEANPLASGFLHKTKKWPPRLGDSIIRHYVEIIFMGKAFRFSYKSYAEKPYTLDSRAEHGFLLLIDALFQPESGLDQELFATREDFVFSELVKHNCPLFLLMKFQEANVAYVNLPLGVNFSSKDYRQAKKATNNIKKLAKRLEARMAI